MNKNFFKVPILFITYNRLESTRKVLNIIRQVNPTSLYIANDGWRDIGIDKEGVQKVRKLVKTINISNTKYLFQKKNLGCQQGVIKAIDWFFDNETEGIILEDDCLPNASFFQFCKIMLSRYKNQPSIMHISGNNFQFGKKYGNSSYYFSKLPHSWGWATWRRAWKLFDISMDTYPAFKRRNVITTIFADISVQEYWINILDRMYKGVKDVWDYQWTFTLWSNNGMSIVPQENLVTNIGFSKNATHTQENSKLLSVPAKNLGVIIHPKTRLVNKEADTKVYKMLLARDVLHVAKRIIIRLLNVEIANA